MGLTTTRAGLLAPVGWGAAALRVVLVIALAACTAARTEPSAGGSVQLAAAGASARVRERIFMRELAAAAQAQVIAGKLAAVRGGEPEVRAFGKQLRKSRLRISRRLRLLSLETQVPLPSRPGRLDDARIARLRALSGDDFDLAFLQQFGIELQERELALYRSGLAANADRGLRRFAQQTARSVEAQLATARELAVQARTRAQAATQEGVPEAAVAQEAPAPALRRERRPGDPWDAEERDAMRGLVQAVAVLRRMKEDRRMDALLDNARGVLVFTQYRRGGLLFGVRAGAGVLVTRHGGTLSAPAFYRLQGGSIGFQVGAAAGSVVYLLMSDAAVQQFRSTRKFSMDAFVAGTLGTQAHLWQSSIGKVRNVIAWSGTHGVYAGAAVGGTRILPDADANAAYYGRPVSAGEILGGLVQNPHDAILANLLGP